MPTKMAQVQYNWSMGILDRIKKQEYTGLKEFVGNLETTSSFKRKEIMALGMLEDPVYMHWVAKNIMNMDKMLEVSPDFYQSLVKRQESYVGVIARAIYQSKYEKIYLESCLPPFVLRLVKEEFTNIKNLKPEEQVGAQYSLFRQLRRMQEADEVRDNPWRLPSKDILQRKDPDINGVYEIKLENGKLAARGNLMGGKRTGQWTFYYEAGQVLAEGDFERGKKVGHWNFYYPEGKILFAGSFQDDNRFGIWSYYEPNGEKIEKEYS